MSSSFTVNKADLEFMLKQIGVAELHASGITLSQAIQTTFGISATDAALVPFGLRTVDGSDNNLLVGGSEIGAADNLFPRLTDPKYVNDTDGDSIDFDGPGGQPPLVQGNYGVPGSVVDADPRTISNLIVNQTAGNPAAVMAALQYSVFSEAIGPGDVNAAAAAIGTAYQLTKTTDLAKVTAQNVEVAAAAVLAVETPQQAAAAAALAVADGELAAALTNYTAAQNANNAAQATLTAYNGALAEDVEVEAAAAQVAAAALLVSLGAAGDPIDSADTTAASDAVTAANAASVAAAAAYALLFGDAGVAPADVSAALGVANAAQLLLTDLTTLEAALLADGDGLLDAGDLATAMVAEAAAAANESAANTAVAQLVLAQAAADAAATAAQTTETLAQGVFNTETSEQAVVQTAFNIADAEYQAALTAFNNAVTASNAADAAEDAADIALTALLASYGIEQGPEGGLTNPNLSPDIGLSPGFNAWMTFFGQFFDHGLDLVTKGGNGTVYVPLQADDPLIAGADGVFGTPDDLAAHLRFMALTRATPTMVDPDGAGPLPAVAQHENTTTSWVDQNQTYTSHPSHQVFLREYERVDTNGAAPGGGLTLSTGRLIDGQVANGSFDKAIGNWEEVKEQALTMLGIRLNDFDVHNVPMIKTDQYGKFIPGPNGYAQVLQADLTWLEGTAAGITTAGSVGTGHGFLNDIAHHAAPGTYDHDSNPLTPKINQIADADPGVGNDGLAATYDDELLNSHFITGDGRGNENIALTTVHSIFHSEHNRLVAANKVTIVESGDLAFLNEWLRVDVAAVPSTPAGIAALQWDGDRLFQAARFVTEMQYQHLVFEEFVRRIQPMVDPFVFTNTAEIDASILAEFAHTVYRFGHSMLTDTVDRLENDLTTVNGEADQQTLIAAFLNPQMYLASGANVEEANANIIRGLSRELGNEIDEFVVPAVQTNLLGLPLDLPALNIARGRETGIPSLNETRAQLYNDFGLADLTPYTSWSDFAQNIKNPLSVVNFIAAYGTHASIIGATTLAAKRAAAMELVLGTDEGVGAAGAPADRLAFLNATGTYAGGSLGGLNNVDLWIGGLAEEKMEFGGMLGSTFNFVFEYQMEQLQNGDRLYYLSRTQGMNLLNQLEPNTFSDLVMRNTALGGVYSTHISGGLFITPDHILELDSGIAQQYADPEWDDPLQQAIDPKVVRTVTGVMADGTHDVGGTLKYSGGEHVVLGGTEGNDRLIGDKGIDTLWGDGGNDYLNGATESDDVFGGEGDDIIEDPFGDDVLRGNQGNDVIATARGFDLVFGDQGNDLLLLGQDAGEVFGGTGNDFIQGGVGQDLLLGNEGDDWIEGGDGFDTIAGENSELFFNSLIVGHDVMFGQGNDQDYDAESGDDMMVSGPGIQRFEGMFGFDWALAKGDPGGARFDFAIPVFTTIPADILKDRFDQVEAASGWNLADVIDGDDRGHVGGSSAPDPVPTELFTEHVLTQAGIDRISGLNAWFGNARTTLGFGTSFRDGNILMGGDGNDSLRGRGGYDILDGDSWLNVRIAISGGFTAESISGKVYNAAGVEQFGGRSLSALMLDRTLNPGQLSIVREILYDTTPGNNTDSAVFHGTRLEYDIEGAGTIVNGVEQRAFDLNGDGFISVHDRDNGIVGATVLGVVLASRGAFTDDTDLLRNIEHLVFADETIAIAGNNSFATGTVTIADPTTFNHDGNNATPALVTPYVGQVLTASLSAFADANGIPLSGGLPVGLTFEWQTKLIGANGSWATVSIGNSYTVRSVDPGHILRAVAVFKDNTGVTERVVSQATDGATVAFAVLENSPTGTLVSTAIPLDGLGANPATAAHVMAVGGDAGGRFKIVLVDGVYQLQVADGLLLDYEAVQGPVDNQYQIVINTYADATLAQLLATRQFTVILGDVNPEGPPPIPPSDINWSGIRPASETVLPLTAVAIASLSTVDPDSSPVVYSKETGSDASIVVSGAGSVSRTGGWASNTTYVLNVKSQESPGSAFITESFSIRTGTGGGNTINGSGLSDIMYGLGGNDTLNGLAGRDTLFGQDGTDTLNGGDANDDLTGGNNNDTITGGAGDDTIRYTIGDDADSVDGGDNSDTLAITGTAASDATLDVVFDGAVLTSVEFGAVVNLESVTADLLAGTDALSYGFSAAGVTVNLTTATASGFTSIAGIENVTGGAGDDTLTGVAGVLNALTGGGGDDTFVVHDTTDTVSEGAILGGTDTVQSFATAFTIADGDVENLTLLGAANISGTGNGSANVITGNAGNNTLNGAGGTDTASYANAAAGVTVSLALAGAQNTIGAGSDTLSNFENLTGSNLADTLTGSALANVISGGGGNDTLTATVDDVSDTLDGGANTDTANYAAYAAALTVNLGSAAPIVVVGSGLTLATSDVLVGIENFTGGSGINTVTGSAGVNILSGGSGNDVLVGGGGNDVLNGDAGNDTIGHTVDSDGADTVNGGLNTDTLALTAGAGNQTLSVVLNGAGVITGFEGGTVTAVESVTANLGAGTGDALSFTGGANLSVNLATGTATGFTSIAGIENVTTNGGNDSLTGDGNANVLSGGGGIDALNGGAGADVLIGGSGIDAINTGAANDNLQDIIQFSATGEFGDTVTNFDADGLAAVDDRVEFGGALNTAYDDGNNNDAFLFATGNGGAGTVSATVGQGNPDIEALLLTGLGGEGVAGANLGNAALVAAAFNSEFVIAAANGEDALLVINDTDGNSSALWQWIQAGAGETSAAELTLIGIFNGNAAVTADIFDFV